ncbi:MAG: hypothetical protein K2W95_23515, partial [Candidatus Obscuribacterales bacterium]|nr:hypothetical protein [Candidatus Obscuribacterales bacterium]
MSKSRGFSRINTVYGKHGLVWLVIGWMAAGPSAAIAQEHPEGGGAGAGSGSGPSANPPPTSVDFSSVNRDVSASGILTAGTVANINVGGDIRSISTMDMLTHAEFFAVQQVLNGNQQSIMLNSAGAAIGGHIDITSIGTSNLQNLVVPTNVSALYNFGASSSPLNISGNLVNNGSFFGYSTNNAVSTAVLSANNIFNNQGGLLSTVLPSSINITGAISGLSLSLNAITNIINAGTISSAGNLTAIAGGSIVNALPAGATGMAPIMQAMQNLTMQASNIINQGTIASQLASANLATANLTNSGLIQSLQGSINVQNLIGQTLNIDGTLGKIQAGDNVLLETLGTTDLVKSGIDVSGQTIVANLISARSPDGVINIHADRLEGPVDVYGGLAFVGAKEGDVTIARMELSGDPIYYASGGNLDLTGLFTSSTFSTSGGDFIGLSSHSIVATANKGDTINASSLTGQGGKIGLYAGVNFSVSGGFSPISCDNCTPFYSISGLSGNTGNIQLGNVSLVTNSSTVTVQANSGGTVAIDSINTSGTLAGQNGGIVRVDAPSTIVTGDITANGAAGGYGGYINVASVLDSVTTGVITSTGDAGGGLVSAVSGSNVGASLGTLGITTAASGAGNAGDVFLRSQTGAVTVGGGINTTATGATRRAGEVTISGLGDVSLMSLNLSGSNSASGGTLSVAGNNVTASGGINTSATGAGANSAGNVALFAEGNVSATTITANSDSGNGGRVSLSAGNSGAGNISVGNVSSTSAGGATSHGGSLTSMTPGITTIGNIDLSNTGTGTGGNLTVLSGTSGTARAAAQSGLLSLGNIKSTGSIRGGDVVVANMGNVGAGTEGNISTGTIDTFVTAQNGRAGSVGMVARGTIITGAIDLQSTVAGSTTALAGDLFLSSGAAGGTGISTGNINLDATAGPAGNRAGNSFFVVNPAVGVTTGTLSQAGGTAGQTFNGTPVTPQANINAATVVTVTPGLVAFYNPGGFDSVGGVAPSLTITTGGDERLLVPLAVRGGNVTLPGVTGTTVGGQPSSVVLLTAGNLTLNGNAVSNTGTQAGGNIFLMSSAGSVNTRAINVDGSTGGGRVEIAASQGYTLNNSFNIQASTATGRGGLVAIIAPGELASGNGINFGTASTTLGNAIFANGVSGGSIYSHSRNNTTVWEFDLFATGTTGGGGNIQARSTAGSVTLQNGTICCTAFYNSDINASTTSGAGGKIFLSTGQNFSSLQDPGLVGINYNTSVIRADGTTGGQITAVAGNNFNIQRTERIDARGLGAGAGAGGAIDITTVGNSTTREVAADGASGGRIQFNTGSFNQTSANGLNFGIVATGSAGIGGSITINSAGATQFGSTGNRSNRDIDVSGTTGGGQINVRSEGAISVYEMEMFANTTNGSAGGINLYSNSGAITLFENSVCCTAYYVAGLHASSTNGAGGNIVVSAFGNFNVVEDPIGGGVNNNVAQIRAAGGTVGGNISITSRTGSIYVDRVNATEGISVNGASGGNLTLRAYQNIELREPAYNNFKPNITAVGSTGAGGNITMTTDTGFIQFGDLDNRTDNAVRASGATNGGTINITAQTNFVSYETDIRADGGTGNGGTVNITSRAGMIELFQASVCCTAYYNGDISANGGANGGNIKLEAPVGIFSREANLGGTVNYSTSSITANGGSVGGRVDLITPGTIDLFRTERVEARGTGASGIGGTVNMQSGLNTTTRQVDASGVISGGNIAMTAGGKYTLTSQLNVGYFNLLATGGAAGTGGSITINANDVELGQTNNRGDNQVNVSGNTGGTISITSATNYVNYETDLYATGGNGNGGTISVAANSGSIRLIQGAVCCTAHYSGNIFASSNNANGGTINLNAATGILSEQDPSANFFSLNAAIRADGAVRGGAVNMTAGGNVDMSRISAIDVRGMNGGGANTGIGGTININAGGLVATRWTNVDGAIGGNINVTAGSFDSYAGHGYLARGFSGAGGNINIASSTFVQIGDPGDQSNIDWSAAGSTSGGTLRITAATTFANYRTDLFLNGGSGNGGTIDIASGGDLTFYQGAVCCTAYYTASSVVSTTSGTGGSITLTSGGNINSIQDGGGPNETLAVFSAASTNGSGGSIKMTAAGQIFMDRIAFNQDSITATGAVNGGVIDLRAAGNITLTSANANWMPRINAGGNTGIGGNIFMTSTGGGITLGSADNRTNNYLNASGTAGGIINLQAFGTINNFETDLLATGSTGRGGSIIVTSDTGAVNLYQGSICCSAFYTSDVLATSTNSVGGNVVITART